MFSFLLIQIQNADDVLISPLEKFRKEQIGAVKVRLQLYVMVDTHVAATCQPPLTCSNTGKQ